MPAVVKTDNTIGFNVIPPVITPVLASKTYIHSIIYFLVPLVRVSINPSYFMIVCVEILSCLNFSSSIFESMSLKLNISFLVIILLC